MKTILQIKLGLLATALAFLGSSVCTQAGSFITDFNSGVPAGSAVFGNATVSPNDGTGGGFTNSGCLQLTPELPSQSGVFVITNDLDAGQPIVSFTATFKALIGSIGYGADGFSFNVASDLDLSGAWPAFEEGNGTGLTVEFDTYPNDAPDTGPSIDVKVGGTEISTSFFPGLRAGVFVDVVIQLKPNGRLDVIYDGVYAVSNLDVSALSPISGGGFGLGSRCGSTTDNHFIDDLSIVTHTNASAFVQSFAPRGRQVQTNSPIDIVLTDSTTQVNTNTIALKRDGVTVSPSITTNGSGNTLIHFAPPGGFARLSTHSVELVFTDNATPTPQTNTLQYGFTVLDSYTIFFSDGFESYTAGGVPLDMNTAGPNASANGNLAGNPWFGPAPPNARVVGTEGAVTPHGGTKMIRGSAAVDKDENWYNLPYRLNGGTPYTGNIMLDWWFYDPLGSGGNTYMEYAAIGYYNTCPNDTDYPGTGSLNSSGQIQRLCLGADSNQSGGYDSTKYQARVVGAIGGYNSAGWFNMPTTRSVGWHHGRIIVGPALPNSAPFVDFYIDDMINSIFSHNAILIYSGYNVLEINTAYGTTFGYFDDVSFGVATPPNLTANRVGDDVVLTWPGLGFTLQSAANVTGSYADVVGATSPYTNSVSVTPQQFFRLRQ